MREILYRGRPDKGAWIYGIAENNSGRYTTMIGRHASDEEFGRYIVLADTIGQYSGLKDHEGTMMFEGDIITGLFIFGMTVKGVVDFDNGSFGVRWWRGDVLSFTPFSSTTNITWKVIGNVHDNPEAM